MSLTEVRPIQAAQTHALRGAVLRSGRPHYEMAFPGDDAPQTLHLGVFDGDELRGIATFYPETAPFEPNLNAYRLRGMAVDAAMQGRGLGRVLLEHAFGELRARGGELLWCNARVVALEFYLALEFETLGEEFVIPEVGPHFVMWRRL